MQNVKINRQILTKTRVPRVKRGIIIGYVSPFFENVKVENYKKVILRGVR